MILRDLLVDTATPPASLAARVVSGVACDSRAVQPGDVFFALPGSKANGAQFIAAARAAGASAIVVETGAAAGDDVVGVANARRALALAAARLYPQQPATIAAVTGTSGKTSVAVFTRQIWQQLGRKAASLGTIGLVSPGKTLYGSLTTPDPLTLHRLVDAVAREGVSHLAVEASSHGLDQHRLDGLKVTAGGFTNLSRDHLDYHPSVAAYFAAKLRLFTDLVAADGTAVIAADHPESATVIETARGRGLRVIDIGRDAAAIRIADVSLDGFAQRLTLVHEGKRVRVRLPLVGAFQVENALVAAGFALASGEEATSVFVALDHLSGAPGRLDCVGSHNGAPIFIDYAHKPDALAKALEALRPYARRRLVVVFGAGGDRDQGKRPLMGAIAAQGADTVIVTDDNPRSEDAAAIRAAILAAAPGAHEIADRAGAIRYAIATLEEGDALVIAGKGHETGQIVGKTTLPFSDHEAVAAALRELTP